MIRNFKRLQIQLSWQRKGKHKEVGYPRGHETFTWAPSSASPNVITHRTGHCPQLTSGVGRGQHQRPKISGRTNWWQSWERRLGCSSSTVTDICLLPSQWKECCSFSISLAKFPAKASAIRMQLKSRSLRGQPGDSWSSLLHKWSSHELEKGGRVRPLGWQAQVGHVVGWRVSDLLSHLFNHSSVHSFKTHSLPKGT